MEKIDLLIKNVAILTLDSKNTSLKNGFIAVKKEKIIAVGVSGDEKNYSAKKLIEGREMLALPGLINAHTHAAMVYFRGIADDLPLKEWLEKHIWPAEAKYVNPHFIREAIKLAAIEMLKSGTTSFCDMYFAEDEAAEVLEQIGIRSFLGEGLLDFPTPISSTPEEGLRRAEELIKKWQGSSLIHPIVAPHAPYTCSADLLKSAKELSDKYNVPLHIHLAEEKWEVEKIEEEKGMSPVAYLQDLDFLGKRTSAAHVNWVSEDDVKILAQTKTGVVHNPESNLKLATGFCPVPDLLSAGVKVALGTDGATSNNNLDMFEEMSLCARLHKGLKKDPTTLKAKEVLRLATMGGAEILNAQDEIGSIEVGKKADIILLDLKQPHLVPLYDLASQVVYAAKSSDVKTVIVNGKIIVENGRILTVDEDEVIAKAQAFAQKFKS